MRASGRSGGQAGGHMLENSMSSTEKPLTHDKRLKRATKHASVHGVIKDKGSACRFNGIYQDAVIKWICEYLLLWFLHQ